MNLLVFNLEMNAEHPVLGHVVTWTNELARRCDHVSVVTMTARRAPVEPNVDVYSLGKERGYSEPRRLVEFYRVVGHVLRERQIDACFAHMAPLFSALFAPVARLRGIPVLLWFAHGTVSPTLRVAHLLADRCVTATSSSFRIPSDKLFVVGHGVDTTVFRPPDDLEGGYGSTALSIGRITPIKRIADLIRAMAILKRRGLDLRLRLVGGPLTDRDRQYEASLRDQCRSLGLENYVTFDGPVSFARVPALYRSGALFLSLSETGSLDKAIIEAMASGCVPVSTNAAFREIVSPHGLDWLVPEPGPEGLAECVTGVLERVRGDRTALTGTLRQIAEQDHSLHSLMDGLTNHLTELATAPR